MSSSPERKNNSAARANKTLRQRTIVLCALFGVLAFVLLVGRLFVLQIIDHNDLQQKAVAQQTRATTITASRGTIYDRNGNILAISATAETIFISPHEIAENKEDTDLIADKLAEILGVDADSVRQKETKTDSYYQMIKLRVEQDTADKVRAFIKENKLKGIYLVEDSKRYYPYGTLASQVIGFVGTDNSGLYGTEYLYNSDLEGTSGLVVTEKNAAGTDVLYKYEQYYDAKNGDSLVLTIDTNIQHYLEQGLSEAIEKFDVKNGAFGIVMDVNTGAILAMASEPTYDLNDPSSVYDSRLSSQLEGLSGSDYMTKLGELQLKQWRNKAINDTYEPGSTFKILTLSMALEEGVIDESSSFYCSGSIRVAGWGKPIYCSKKSGHGAETLAKAVANSCNPAFIQIGLKVGTEKFYQYVKDFGLMDKTGIDLVGESTGLFFDEKSFNSQIVSLASAAFGQTFTVTPIGLITAEAAAVNGGYLHTPYIVSQIVDANGNIVKEHDTTPVRQVVSEETSKRVCALLEGVVNGGTGKNAYVSGYRIGGKTGTADKTGSKTAENPRGDVIVSFVAVAPIDDPQIIMLIALDTPSRDTGYYVSGGIMAAPTAGNILSNVLPYIGVEPDYSAGELVGADANVPNCVGLAADEAKKKLTDSGFACKTVGTGATVTDQTPAGGAIVPGNATIVLYLGAEKPTGKCTVPNVVGKTAEQANNAITGAGLIMKITGDTSGSSGNVYVLSQSAAAGDEVDAGTVVSVKLTDTSLVD